MRRTDGQSARDYTGLLITHGSRYVVTSQHHDVTDEDVDQFRLGQYLAYLCLAVSGHVTF